jgi:hypothetical protein
MAPIQRLKLNEIQNGLVINANDINAELDQLVTSANTQDTSLTSIATGTFSFTGTKTFANTVKAGTIIEAVATQGVTIATVRLRDGTVRPKITTNPTTPEAGEIWFNDTNKTYQGFVSGAPQAFALLPKNWVGGTAPSYVSATQILLPEGTSALDTSGQTLIQIRSAGGLTLSLDSIGALGLDFGLKAANTWYYVWLAQGSSGVTALFSTSLTTPVLPTGYNTTSRRLPFALRTDASGAILSFFVDSGWPNRPIIRYTTGTLFYLGPTPLTTVVLNGNATVSTAVSCSSFVPPISRVTHLNLFFGSGAGTVIFRETGATIEQCSLSGNTAFIGNLEGVRLNSSQSMDYRVLWNGTSMVICVRGYTITED